MQRATIRSVLKHIKMTAEKLNLQSSGKILSLSTYELWGSQVKGIIIIIIKTK
jgi:hypothetical protein